MRGLERLAGIALLLPVVAAWMGSSGPRIIDFNLGPGDTPYLEGFLPAYEIDEKLATHWTTYDATIALPLRVEGGPVNVVYRYARVFGETAEIEVDVSGVPIDRFSRRGGAFEERHGSLAVLDTPLSFAVRCDSHERQNMGIKLDWVRFDLGDQSSVRLIGWAFWQPIVITLMLLVVWIASGAGVARAATLTAPLALALGFGLWSDPWLTHRLVRGLAIAVPLFGLAVLGIGRLIKVDRATLRLVFGFMLVAFLVRAAAVNHPDFYYSDLRTHARLVGFVHEAGLDFLVSPSSVITEHNVWVTEAYGQTYAFPYTPMFHLPFAFFDLGYDALVLTLKLAAAAISTVPIALVWAFSRSFGFASPVPVVGAILMVVIPTYSSRLSYAFLPSLFGHAVDIAFVYWIFAISLDWPRGVNGSSVAFSSRARNWPTFPGLSTSACSWPALLCWRFSSRASIDDSLRFGCLAWAPLVASSRSPCSTVTFYRWSQTLPRAWSEASLSNRATPSPAFSKRQRSGATSFSAFCTRFWRRSVSGSCSCGGFSGSCSQRGSSHISCCSSAERRFQMFSCMDTKHCS